jgi:hypothetical protein
MIIRARGAPGRSGTFRIADPERNEIYARCPLSAAGEYWRR